MKVGCEDNKSVTDSNSFMLLLLMICMHTVIKALFFENVVISVVIAIFETMIVFCELLRNDLENFILLFLLFCTTSIENSMFSTGNRTYTLYCFLNLPFARRYHLLVLLLIGCLKCWPCSSNRKLSTNIKNPAVCIFLFWCFEMFVSGMTYLLDDNGVRTGKGLLRYIILDAYNSFWMVGVFFIVWQLLNNLNGFGQKLKQFLLASLAALSIAGFLLYCLGNTRVIYSGWQVYLQCPVAIMFSPVLILAFFAEEKHRVLFLLLGVGTLILQVKATVGIAGTWWIMMSVFGLIFIYRLLSSCVKRYAKGKDFGLLIIICIGILLIYIFGNFISLKYSHVLYKWNSIRYLFASSESFWDWYRNMNGSIGVRVESLINIFLELVQKPYFWLFGKGFGGSIVKHWGTFNWDVYGSTFPDIQIKNQVYSSFHLGVSELFVNFGISGLVLLLKIVVNTVKEILYNQKNIWIIIGLLWLCFFFTFYYSLCFGVACLCYGLYLYKNR